MWQLSTLASLFFNAAETATDKLTMVADRKLDAVVTSFYRCFIFAMLAVAVGATGLIGRLEFRLSWPIIIVALLEIGTSIFYSILLKRVEMTGAAAFSYITPFLFLLIDVFIISAPLSLSQIVGILLLILGGVVFVIDPTTRRLKSQYTKYIWLILLYNMIAGGAQYYLFKYYATNGSLNEISYIVNVWSYATISLLLVVLLSHKWHLLYKTAISKQYVTKTFVGKSFDLVAAWFWFRALSLATVSQVNSLAAFNPLILLIVLFVVQQFLKLRVDEDFSKQGLFQKAFATTILIIGAWLSS